MAVWVPAGVQEQESQDLLERFRLAHTTLEERDQKLQQAQGLTSSIRLELLSSDTERRHLRQTISHQETEIQQVSKSTAHSFSHKRTHPQNGYRRGFRT